ncbi:probable galacturonosyltransferase 9 [Vigna umbellata]|uniref:probable galacturonosyltransferase 9 n=1 Tax=Vigna umbellata TaxID=87088 RepID=UPI001F5F1046|nr:probable galacturonosyltransferase 9 [Vigna umbellata]
MAVATRGTRGGSTFRGLFSFRIFISAMFSLLFIATLSVLFTNNPSTSQDVSDLPTTGYARVPLPSKARLFARWPNLTRLRPSDLITTRSLKKSHSAFSELLMGLARSSSLTFLSN